MRATGRSAPRHVRAYARVAAAPLPRLLLAAGAMLAALGIWDSVGTGEFDRLVGTGALLCAAAAWSGRRGTSRGRPPTSDVTTTDR